MGRSTAGVPLAEFAYNPMPSGPLARQVFLGKSLMLSKQSVVAFKIQCKYSGLAWQVKTYIH